ncbi:hypothetical protein HN510_00060, partial [Candidatus Woesearchaeota archaeon]|nr:hypothetical protein [Candidatus Woesearchaeota archaeon]
MRIKILLVLALILLVSNVTAIGVRPAKQEMDFEPSLSTDITFTVRNTKDAPVSVIVEVED